MPKSEIEKAERMRQQYFRDKKIKQNENLQFGRID